MFTLSFIPSDKQCNGITFQSYMKVIVDDILSFRRTLNEEKYINSLTGNLFVGELAFGTMRGYIYIYIYYPLWACMIS